MTLVVLAGACSGGGGARAAKHRSRSASTTAATTTAPSPTATAADLRAVAVKLTPIAKLDALTALAVRANDATLYVTEQVGRVRAVRDGRLVEKPVIDLSDRTLNSGEQGLLGLAFSPDGSKLYVHYSDRTNNGDNQIDEYRMDGGAADPSSRRPILTLETLQANHNGGQITFGPDGELYVGFGDGGAAGDQGPGHAPGGNGQSLDTLLGKIVRIDPTPSGGRPYAIPPGNPFANGGGRPEIWAYGLRNPWRFSWDRATNDLWIADVGQNAWEEVDYVPSGQRAGFNFGWNRFEGTHQFQGSPPDNAVPPIFEFSHDDGNCSVTGGYVYRGSRIPNLRGAYVFTDYCNSSIRALVQQNGRVTTQRDLGIKSRTVAAFGEDRNSEIYVLSQDDGLLRLDPA